MQNPNESPHVSIATRWRRLNHAWRIANRATHHVLGFSVKLILLTYLAFVLLLLLLRYVILPNIDFYKGDIEHLASQMAGNQVTIARIYGSWNGLRPNLFLGDVVLKDKAGRQVLSLPSVSATLSWWSVAALDLRFESLVLTRPELEVRRELDGKLYAGGIYFDPLARSDGRGADWVLSQPEIVIREGQLHWSDRMRGTPMLALDQVNLVLRNKWRRHQFAVHATPPASLGQPVDLKGNFVHPPFARKISDFAQWKGELFTDVKVADLAAWKTYFSYPFDLQQGQGSVRAWLSVDHARLSEFTADLSLRNFAARMGSNLLLLDLVRVNGRVTAKQVLAGNTEQALSSFGRHGQTVTLNDFSLATRDGLILPPMSLSERHVAATGKQAAYLDIKADEFDLHTAAALLARLPLAPAQRQLMQDLAPRGRLLDFSAHWQMQPPQKTPGQVQAQVQAHFPAPQPPSPVPVPAAWQLAGRLEDFGMTARPARQTLPAIPGVENLSGSFDVSEHGGSIRVASSKLVVQMPGYLVAPAMPFEQFNMQAHWQREAEDVLRVQLDALNFVQQGMSGSLSGSHIMHLDGTPAKSLGTADFSGTLNNFDLKTIGRYLPLQTPPDLRAWLTGALVDGVAHDVTLRLRGDLVEFPFKGDRAGGVFRIAGRLEQGVLNYAPGHLAKDGKAALWPYAENIQGSFLFDRARMEIRAASARTGGVALKNVKAVIADLSSADKMLDIDGNAFGPMQRYLAYVGASPVLDWISSFTDDTSATGNATLALQLHLPLDHLLDSTVQGSLGLMNNDVLLFSDLPVLAGSSGKIEFNEKGVNLNGLKASFMGGPVAISGGSVRDNAIVVRIAGSVSSDGLRNTYPAPVMQRLASHFSGNARYSGVISASDQKVQIAVESNLAGLGLDFPVPVKKARDDALPLKFVMNIGAPSEAGVTRDDIKVSLGTSIAAHYQRQKRGREPWTVLRAGIGVNLPAPEPDSGLMLSVKLPSINVDDWSDLGTVITAPLPGEMVGVDANAPDLAQYVSPDILAALSTELIIGGRKLDHVVIGASHQKGVWQANLVSAQASGYLTWSTADTVHAGANPGLSKVTARLSSLTIAKSKVPEVEDLLEASNSAQSMPALDIVVDRFELFDKQLGRLELQANNAQVATEREWRISQLSLVNPDGALKGSGKWSRKNGQSSTSLNFGLDITDAGRLLERFGFADTLRGGKGKLNGDIVWSGSPYSLDIPSLSGKVEMNVAAGQFLKQDPGAARLLNVLSLQALPRLLKLDFHDIFSEGLAFDGISADAQITHGVIATNNLNMHGVAATVLMSGSADIAHESTNLHVVVIPEINLGTGPLVYALAVNPVIGISSFLAQLFLRVPVMKALTYQMQIVGPWKAPVVTKLKSEG